MVLEPCRARVAYGARAIFDSSYGGWPIYLKFARFSRVREIVSIGGLCPSVVSIEESRLVTAPYESQSPVLMRGLCDSLDYLMTLLHQDGHRRPPYQVLAAMSDPTEGDVADFADDRFVLKGFDLLNANTSALTNCGGFDMAFTEADLNDCGLIPMRRDAYRISESLRSNYPYDIHSECVVWAIWRMEPPRPKHAQ